MTLNKINEDLKYRIKKIYRNLKILNIFYYVFGFIALVLNILITSLSSKSEPDMDTIFIISIIVSVISTSLTFFKIETKINNMKHDTSQYKDIITEIDTNILDDENNVYFEKEILQKIKLIEDDDVYLCF